MVILSYCSKFHLTVSWAVFLPPEEESLAPPALLVAAGVNKVLADPEQSSDTDTSAVASLIIPKSSDGLQVL